MTLQIPGVVSDDDDTPTSHTEPYQPPPPATASKTDIPGVAKDPEDQKSLLTRAWQFIRSDLPEAVIRDLTPSVGVPGSAPSTPAPGLVANTPPDVPPQIVSNPNAYMARGARDVTDKLAEYPNPEYGYVPGQSDLDQVRAQNAKDRAEFNQKYSYDPAMPWFRGVGQAAVTAPVVGPGLQMIGAGADVVAPGVGTFITGGSGAGVKGLPGFLARTVSRAAEGGTAGAGIGALTADPSQPIAPQIGTGALWGLGTGAALSPVLEGLPRLATQTVPGELPPVNRSGTSKGIAGVAFDQADNAGAGLTAGAINRAMDNVDKITTVSPDAKGVASPNDATALQTRLQTLRDQPLSLSGLRDSVEEINKQIDKHINDDGTLDTVGRDLWQMKNALTDAAKNAAPADVTGDPAGFQAWRNGNAAWQVAQQQAQVERIAQWAAGKADPASAAKTRINNMLADPDQMRGWSPEDKAGLKQAGETGFLSDFGKNLSDRFVGSLMTGAVGTAVGGALSPLVSPLIGVPAGLATGVASQTAMARAVRGLQEAYTNRQIEGLLTQLGERIRGQQTPGLLGQIPPQP